MTQKVITKKRKIMTAVDCLIKELKDFGYYTYNLEKLCEQAKEMENIEKLKKQLFIGKVSEIIGFEKTVELLKQCNETFNK